MERWEEHAANAEKVAMCYRRRIMLKHYGEDYEGMHGRAILRAQERESEAKALAVDNLKMGFTTHSPSRVDYAMAGNVACMLESCFGTDYFPASLSPEQRRSKWTLTPDTSPVSKTLGSNAPGRHGLISRGHLRLDAEDEGRKNGGKARKAADALEEALTWDKVASPEERERLLDAEAAAVDEAFAKWLHDLLKRASPATVGSLRSERPDPNEM
jgi:hypothetical protein